MKVIILNSATARNAPPPQTELEMCSNQARGAKATVLNFFSEFDLFENFLKALAQFLNFKKKSNTFGTPISQKTLKKKTTVLNSSFCSQHFAPTTPNDANG